jgi:hypothetical protein
MKFLIVAALLIGTLTAAPYIDTKAVLAQVSFHY